MSFEVIKLSVDDIQTARQLFNFFQADDGVQGNIVSSDEYLTTLLSKENFHVLVAMQNGNLIGGLTAYELEMYKEPVNEMFLYEIAVKSGYREKGVAKALILFLKGICKEKGITEMYVGTSTDNHAAIKLYKATGAEQDRDIAWYIYTFKK